MYTAYNPPFASRLEIWFPAESQVSVSVETLLTHEAQAEVTEVALFTAFAGWISVALGGPRNEFGMLLSSWLAEVPDEGWGEMPIDDGPALVPAMEGPWSKGFEGTLKIKNELPFLAVKPKGFGLRGKGAGYYGPSAVLALFVYLHGRHSFQGRFMLTEAARAIGAVGASGSLSVRNVPQAAGSIVHDAMSKLDGALTKRSDDPLEDYAMLLRYAWSILSDNGWGPGEQGVAWASGLPDWVLWRFTRQAVLFHRGYDFQTASPLGEQPGEYEEMLERMVAEGELEPMVERLYVECFGEPSSMA